MASMNKITDIIAAMKVIYPYYGKDMHIKTLATMWHNLLKPYDDDLVEIGMNKCLTVCKMPPTPADVIEQIKSFNMLGEQTDEELWSDLTRALYLTDRQMYRFGFTLVEANGKTQGDNARDEVEKIWQGLPDRLKQYLGSKGELMRMARNYNDEELKFEKTRFQKTMPIIKKREEYSELNLLLGNSNLMLE